MTASFELISVFESAVYSRKYILALKHLCHLLNYLDKASKNTGNDGYFDTSSIAQINSTRIASAIICMLSDNKFKVDRQTFAQLIIHKRTITSIFRVSGFSGTQNSIAFFTRNTKQNKNRKKASSQLYKMLILMSLSDHNEQTLAAIEGMEPEISVPYILSLLSSNIVLSETEYLVREKLLSFGPIIHDNYLDFSFAGIFSNAWMYCSYAEKSDKHQFKKHLNNMMKITLEKSGFSQPKIKAIDRQLQKPKILILAEEFNSAHAMGRCYTYYILQLKRHFEVVLCTSNDKVDQASLSIFDQTVIFDLNETSVLEISQLVVEQNADIVFYPSLGMAAWTLALLPLRFAPIQIIATGHPATSMADSIDYIVAPEFLLTSSELYSERLLCLSNRLDCTHANRKDEIFPKAKINQNPQILRVAVNGKSFKINASFIALCQHINKSVNRAIEWIFFPNEVGLQYYHFNLEISQSLPNAQVIKNLPYNDYLEVINQCDIAISPFPFGGSNSNVDLLRLGIPLIHLTGDEAHSRTDEFFFKFFELNEKLSCNSIEELYFLVKDLIEDNTKRTELSQLMQNLESNSLLISDTILTKTDVLDAFRWVWSNHSEILHSNIRYFAESDRTMPFHRENDFESNPTSELNSKNRQIHLKRKAI